MVVQNEAFKSSMVSFKGGDAPDAEFISTVIKISYLFGNADGLPQAAAILCEWAQSKFAKRLLKWMRHVLRMKKLSKNL